MGILRRTVRFGSEDGGQWVTREAVIDTGATHCQIPADVAIELHTRLYRRGVRVVLADGNIQERDIVYVLVEVDPSLPAILTTATVGPEAAACLVGAVALEQLSLGTDPSTQRLVPELPVLLRTANWPTA